MATAVYRKFVTIPAASFVGGVPLASGAEDTIIDLSLFGLLDSDGTKKDPDLVILQGYTFDAAFLSAPYLRLNAGVVTVGNPAVNAASNLTSIDLWAMLVPRMSFPGAISQAGLALISSDYDKRIRTVVEALIPAAISAHTVSITEAQLPFAAQGGNTGKIESIKSLHPYIIVTSWAANVNAIDVTVTNLNQEAPFTAAFEILSYRQMG
jgi:hypothetical protein